MFLYHIRVVWPRNFKSTEYFSPKFTKALGILYLWSLLCKFVLVCIFHTGMQSFATSINSFHSSFLQWKRVLTLQPAQSSSISSHNLWQKGHFASILLFSIYPKPWCFNSALKQVILCSARPKGEQTALGAIGIIYFEGDGWECLHTLKTLNCCYSDVCPRKNAYYFLFLSYSRSRLK